MERPPLCVVCVGTAGQCHLGLRDARACVDVAVPNLLTMPDDSRLRLIRALGDTLDGLDVALCAVGDGDRTRPGTVPSSSSFQSTRGMCT